LTTLKLSLVYDIKEWLASLLLWYNVLRVFSLILNGFLFQEPAVTCALEYESEKESV